MFRTVTSSDFNRSISWARRTENVVTKQIHQAMTSVRLSVPQVHFAMGLATQRDACKKDRDSRISRKHTGFGVHLAGVIGELCFRNVYGGKIDTRTLPDGDGHGPDIVLPDGRKVEVKTSLFSGPDVEMKLKADELGLAEFYSLVQVTLPDSGVVWPIWPWSFIEPRLIKKDYGYGPTLAFKPQDFSSEAKP